MRALRENRAAFSICEISKEKAAKLDDLAAFSLPLEYAPFKRRN